MKYTLTASLIFAALAGFSCKGGPTPPTLSKQDSVEIMMAWTEVQNAQTTYQGAVQKWQAASAKCGEGFQVNLDAVKHDITCKEKPASPPPAPVASVTPVQSPKPADNSLGKKTPSGGK